MKMKWKKLKEFRPFNKRQILITNGQDIAHYSVYKEGEDIDNPASSLRGTPEFDSLKPWGETTHWMYLTDIDLPDY